MEIQVHRFLPVTSAEGPGRRACVWVQGCSIRCPGCFNPHTWSTNGGQLIPAEEIARRVLDAPAIEGVTLLGGEPFDQAEGLAVVGSLVQQAGLSVMTFTGHEYETLINTPRPGWTELLDVTDLLVDGPYIQSLPDHDRPWVGSRNQRFHFLSPRYAHLASELHLIPNRVEVRLGDDGEVLINGMPPAGLIEGLLDEPILRLRKRSSVIE